MRDEEQMSPQLQEIVLLCRTRRDAAVETFDESEHQRPGASQPGTVEGRKVIQWRMDRIADVRGEVDRRDPLLQKRDMVRTCSSRCGGIQC